MGEDPAHLPLGMVQIVSRPIRFIGVAILVWAGVRAVSLGLAPETRALAFDLGSTRPRPLPPIQPTPLPPIEPLWTSERTAAGQPVPAPYMPYPAPASYPIYVPVPVAAAGRTAPPQVVYLSPPPGDPREIHVYGSQLPGQRAEAAPLPSFTPVRQSTPQIGGPVRPAWLDHLSLSSWAMMRNEAGPDSLAGRGMLGGSEAGARAIWRLTPKLAASLRASAPLNSQRGVEAAIGLRYQPLADWPVAFTLERRHGFRDYGRNAFALFAEGGVYDRPMPWQSALDGYFQAGVVDFNNPDWFVDGQLAVARPVWRSLSAGVGLWGGAQPGLSRLDAGPRLSLRVGTRMRAHADYRVNLAGNATPGSGPVLTLAGDF